MGDNIGPTTPDVTFKDVQGMDFLKRKLTEEIIWPMEDSRYSEYMWDYARGILLEGPPGCGKSYLAEALAGEAKKSNISYFNPNMLDIGSKYVGVSEKRLRACFEAALRNEPSILFFGELDTLGGIRDGAPRHSVELTNAFLQAYSAVGGGNVAIVGESSEPWELSPALTRLGRLSSRIYVPPPDLGTRKAMFKSFLKDKKTAEDINYDYLSEHTKYYASSDIQTVCYNVGAGVFEQEVATGKPAPVTQSDLEREIENENSSLLAWAHRVKIELTGELRGNKLVSKYRDEWFRTYIEEADKILETLKGGKNEKY